MESTTVKPRLLNTAEAARYLGVSAGTLVAWRFHSRYRLPYVRIGRNIRYQEADLIAWLEQRKVNKGEPEEAYA
jgi:excisionase family DNA binding protein